MTDASGTVVWAADYKPFGEVTITVSTITNNLRFPGQYYDAETGNHYNYYRDYNPAIGGYTEADPVGILQGQNHLYSYVDNNPLVGYDLFGLVDLKKMVQCLDRNTKGEPQGTCAKNVRTGIEAGGGDTSERPRFAKDYGPFLEKLGFKSLPAANYNPKLGDIAVFQPWPGVTAGHVQCYNGSSWVSDYTQDRFLPSRKATDYKVYRQP